MKKKLLGYYDYTVILTYCGMLFAVHGIFRVLNEDFLSGIICLMIAGLCDMFDGAVASTRDRSEPEKRFGIQIDSLSDLISFGLLPALFVYRILGQSAAAGFCAAIYVLCALIRLAYFNVLEEQRQSASSERRKSYLGVPVTTIAVLLPAMYILSEKALLRSAAAFPAMLILTAAGFLIPVEIRKPHLAGKLCILLLGVAEASGLIAIAVAELI